MMDRWACVDAFDFPLQVLLTLRPEWRDEPVAVVDRDGPRGRLLYLNSRARKAGLRRQMTFSQATSLVPALRTDTVEVSVLKQRSLRMASQLEDFSPRVEQDENRPGLSWLDVSGLDDLYEGWESWIKPLRKTLRDDHDLFVAVVVGFTRFGTFAVVRSTKKSGVFESLDSERQAAKSVELDRLGLDSPVLQTARRLGIQTIGDLLDLPPEGVRRRLGDRAFRLYRRARGDLQRPRPAFRPSEGVSRTDRLDHVETDQNRLLFLVKRHLHDLFEALDSETEKITALKLTLHRDDEEPLEADIRPAEPTRDGELLTDLVRLRLETLSLGSGVTDITLEARGERTTTTEQLHLFADESTRDIEAANRALARLRAEFGPDSVLRINPDEGHLPESRFELSRLQELSLPDVEQSEGRPAIRRFFPTPMSLPDRLDASLCAGPHVISGGWWIRKVRRNYHFAESENRLLWLFFDHQRCRWYIHGEF